jgi:hypothetical protein
MTAALSTYLNDHSAGARLALTLLERLADTHEEHRDWLTHVREEITADHEILLDIMRRLGITESTVKQVSSWIGERMASLKLTLESPNRTFHRLEALEALALGILGKHKLWIALAEVAPDYPAIAQVDFDRLKSRALDQHDQVERERMAAALTALRRRAAAAGGA